MGSTILAIAGVWILGCAFCAGLTGIIRSYARCRLMDHPNERSSHDVPTPRGGGLSIVLALLLAGGVLAYWVPEAQRSMLALLGGGGLVAAIGFWDDHRPLSVRLRLGIQFVAAAISISLIAWPNAGSDWSWLLAVVGCVGLVWLTNLYNFMDGTDGIAGIEGVFVGGAGSIILMYDGLESLAWLSALLGGGCAGFLAWNWPKARIFMGDVGSGFLGFAFGILALQHAAMVGRIMPWEWLILLSLFLVDATVTLLVRIVQREPWLQAHRSHAYQRAARKWSHATVLWGAIGINLCWLLPAVVLLRQWSGREFTVAALALGPLIMLSFGMPDRKVESQGIGESGA